MKNPHFIIKNESQQYSSGRGGFLFETILTSKVLSDVCNKITGKTEYTFDFDNSGYNKGRAAVLEFGDKVAYITFSDHKADGRNKSFQSVATALMSYFMEPNPMKDIFFYFLPSEGNYKTPYHCFMYRILLTLGVKFLNSDEFLGQPLIPFVSVEDLIANREVIRGRNRSNNSSYMTIGLNRCIQIYGKTYGANKYESALLCVALKNVTDRHIEFFNIKEKNLSQLPQIWISYLDSKDGISVYNADIAMEEQIVEKNINLRSPKFIFNLFVKLGQKKCALCACEIPELVQAAHIWPIASIKSQTNIDVNHKIMFATDGDNGIWLCENHHTMFDEGIIVIDKYGRVKIREDVSEKNTAFVDWSMPIKQLEPHIMTEQFIKYMEKRYEIVA